MRAALHPEEILQSGQLSTFGIRQLCRPGPRTPALLCIFILLLPSNGTAADDPLETYSNVLAQDLPVGARGALDRVEGTGRKLLALRSYLKNAASLSRLWSWSSSEIETYEKSPEHAQAMAAVERVRRQFELKNPGFTLHVNTQTRSLELQIERWNSNETVRLASVTLEGGARARVKDLKEGGAEWLRHYLVSWYPPRPVSLAAPGLSAHGRARAFDFQIQRGDRIVAGTDVKSVARDWDASGWTRKLEQAVIASGANFVGPLAVPHEPWHYDFRPAATGERQ